MRRTVAHAAGSRLLLFAAGSAPCNVQHRRLACRSIQRIGGGRRQNVPPITGVDGCQGDEGGDQRVRLLLSRRFRKLARACNRAWKKVERGGQTPWCSVGGVERAGAI